MSDHETTLRNAVAELDEWLSKNGRVPNHSQVVMRAACLAGADALRRGTCGTCKNWKRGGRGGVFPLSCRIRVGRWASDDYCNMHDAKEPTR